MTPFPLKAVFDCNIFVQMLLNPRGSAAKCKALVATGQITLFVSQTILAEVVDVLNRPRFKQLVPDLTTERIDAFVEEIAALAIAIRTCQRNFVTNAILKMSHISIWPWQWMPNTSSAWITICLT